MRDGVSIPDSKQHYSDEGAPFKPAGIFPAALLNYCVQQQQQQEEEEIWWLGCEQAVAIGAFCTR